MGESRLDQNQPDIHGCCSEIAFLVWLIQLVYVEYRNSPNKTWNRFRSGEKSYTPIYPICKCASSILCHEEPFLVADIKSATGGSSILICNYCHYHKGSLWQSQRQCRWSETSSSTVTAKASSSELERKCLIPLYEISYSVALNMKPQKLSWRIKS